MTFRESVNAPEYRLIVQETFMSATGPTVEEIAYAPVTTIAGCKRLYTKNANQMRNYNIRETQKGFEPFYLALSGRIEVASWNHETDLPNRTDLV